MGRGIEGLEYLYLFQINSRFQSIHAFVTNMNYCEYGAAIARHERGHKHLKIYLALMSLLLSACGGKYSRADYEEVRSCMASQTD